MRALEEIQKDIQRFKPEYGEACMKMIKLKAEKQKIEKEIEEFNAEYEKICNKMFDLCFEEEECSLLLFNGKYGVKKGDIVQLKDGRQVQLIHLYEDSVIVHIKNQETGEINDDEYMYIKKTDFEGCKVIDHIDID